MVKGLGLHVCVPNFS